MSRCRNLRKGRNRGLQAGCWSGYFWTKEAGLCIPLSAVIGCRLILIYAYPLVRRPQPNERPMTQAKSGDTVRIHYTGTLDDGSTFDSSEGRDPLEFTLGSGQVIPGFDVGVTGMKIGDKKTINIPCVEAYGELDPNARQDIPRDSIPADIPLDIGTQLQMQAPDGQAMMVTVAEVTDENVTLDANHPLAGKDLTFALELVSIG